MNNFVTQKCDKEDGNYICRKIDEYNRACVDQVVDSDVIHITRKITNENGDIIAGITGSVYLWDCMSIDLFWIHEDFRKKGIGSILLNQVESEARHKGCNLVHLDTYDFQAKDFYVKNGYEIYGVLDDCPKGHKRYSLKKAL